MKPTNYFLLTGPKVYEKTGKVGFDLILANGERRSMQAQTEEERDAWCEALDLAHDRKSEVTLVSSESESSARSKAARRMSPDDFNFSKVLGKGNYGKVMLATLKDDPTGANTLYAVKIVKKSGLMDDESLEHVLAENRVLQTLDHPFLVKLHYSFQTADRLYFVMEYVSGGEIFFHIGREKRFSETRVRFYAGEILLALQYLHQHNIVYRDLKLENLLLDVNGHIKITDFGLVKEDIGYEGTTSTFCGTPEYLAPEVLEEENYGRSVDWWALGVVLYEMLIGKVRFCFSFCFFVLTNHVSARAQPPFGPTTNMEKLFQNIMNQPVSYPATLSESARSLLEGLLCRDCTKRLGCGPGDGDELRAHPFFAGIDFGKLESKGYQAPFKPQVIGATDVSNFDKEFTTLPAVLTPENGADGGATAMTRDFENFTFVGPSVLARADASTTRAH